ncbi:NUDIX domain-containing protein [Devosia sp.]|uniref:NUDIX domain-containing protein n=1 Tax=Devosia sp. TaxID=1871048 RepID=UPI0027344506|nr:NUDIX hydrolase [Devosia sp.]MDP2782169.1 NUDIX hydrolase [Devosia sp.]
MQYRISAGALVLRDNRLLLLRHFSPRYDFWAPPGGGVEGHETLEAAAERETLEETGLTVKARRLAYIDEVWSATSRTIKLWFVADCAAGVINLDSNPAPGESIVEAVWLGRGDPLPGRLVFPLPLHGRFWVDLATGFATPIRLPLQRQQV